MRKTVFFLLLFAVSFSGLKATHNRAGEITYTWLGGYTYEAVVTTYTKESAVADRCQLVIYWGDGDSSTVYRENGPSGSCAPPARMGEDLGDDVRKNIYRGQHTYQAPGFYTVSMEDPNRNSGVTNIPNSVTVPFYISSLINVNPFLGANSSPVLLNLPVDDGCLNEKYIHNPGAWDADGDSLGFELVDCRGLSGMPLPSTYSASTVQDPVTIDAFGNFVWDVPKSVGQYNFAFTVTEYRKGPNGIMQVIGQITRDMQVNIYPCPTNKPPQLLPIGPFCVEVGQKLDFTVQATDPDGDGLTLTATGGPLEVPPTAQFAQPTVGIGSVQQVFSWTPACNQVQKNPWVMFFKVVDQVQAPETPVADYLTVDITVIAPAPENLQAVPSLDAINLSWDASICTEAVGYKLYRREGFYGYQPDSCETGVPAYTGYTFLADVNGLNNTNYVDTNNLKRGMQYCYMVIAVFADGAESRASEEACTELAKTTPIITHVDVQTTDAANGTIFIDWIPPRDIDSALFPPPYGYVLERALGIEGGSFSPIATFSNFNDTTHVDGNLNTQDNGYTYRVGFTAGASQVVVGYADAASSVYLEIFPFDGENRLTIKTAVPWLNERYVVYRENAQGDFDSIANTTTPNYRDTGLVNGETYCYKVQAVGRYTGTGLPDPLRNHSQIACASPLDTTPPCPLPLQVVTDCEAGYIIFSWQPQTGIDCSPDITAFQLYYKPTAADAWPGSPLVANIPATDTAFVLSAASVVGCYAITALDDQIPPLESDFSNIICVDGCALIELPNVFTPNADGVNDVFTFVRDANGNPLFRDVAQFEINIFNRWGTQVYENSDGENFAATGWDGTDLTTSQPVAAGVYFYTIAYTPKSVFGADAHNLSGTVTIFR